MNSCPAFRPALTFVLALVFGALASSHAADLIPGVRKVRDLVVYEDAKFYAVFPSVVRRADGELLLAFRRAPSRVALHEKGESHLDPNRYLVMVRSRDGAATWTKEPQLIYAHALGGSQDPCLLQLRDGTLLCTSYGWAVLQPEGLGGAQATRRGEPERSLPRRLLGAVD